MGGYGSGRWGSHTKATTVHACRQLDAGGLARDKLLRPGVWRTGLLRWQDSRTGEEQASVGWEVRTQAEPWWLRLTYTVTCTGEKLSYPVVLQTTRPGFGGLRWWFTCPLVVNGVACDRRVGKLYLPPGGKYFGCRNCHRLTYTSAQEHDARVDRLRRNPAALQALLDDSAGAPVGQLLLALKALR
jgi:hypothetical protein